MTRNNVIGVTGITGSGTSTAAKILAERGGLVINADKLAHEIMLKGEAAYEKITEAFGAEILDGGGEINRRKLGIKVFGNAAEMAKLENIIHPEVIAKAEILLQNNQHPFAVIDAPMLIESGMNKLCGMVWLITANDDIRLARIQARDGISQETAERRLKSRKGDDFLKSYADVIIENNGSLHDLESKILKGL